jgi:hypothetical protein
VGKRRRRERRLRDFELRDLEAVLRAPEGRGLVYRIIFELCGVEGPSFDPNIKDGICSALFTARAEGRREIGIVLRNEARDEFPDLWRMVLADRLQRDAAEDTRKQLEDFATSVGDDE